jgi:predicted nucleic acid-binding Zn ribbon protein
MPMYAWEHKKTKEIIEVIRSFDDSDVPPTKEEAKGLTGKWEKIIGGKQTILKGRGWGPGKGNW